MFKIEKVPDAVLSMLQRADRKGVKKYPFADMAVGDSFTVRKGVEANRAKSACRAFAARNNVRFSVIGDEANSVRVVRIG